MINAFWWRVLSLGAWLVGKAADRLPPIPGEDESLARIRAGVMMEIDRQERERVLRAVILQHTARADD